MALTEAAGFDVVFIETVGVGQSETMVAGMSDLFVLLIAPAGGDELQGVKRGIMESADLILVNKADGELKATATRTCADYAGALRLLRKRPEDPEEFPKAATVSAATGSGLDTAWEDMKALAEWRRSNGHWRLRRAAQAKNWFEQEVRHGLLAQLTEDTATRNAMDELAELVTDGKMTAGTAAAQILARIRR